MGQISKETVEEFRKTFNEEYVANYTYNEAWEALHNLVGFYDTLLKMDMKQSPENYRKKIGEFRVTRTKKRD
jgi:hypothetical protein